MGRPLPPQHAADGAPASDERPAPWITVLTPTYNRAGTLPRVHGSLAAQTFRDFEWLIVDDGSADGTRALVEKWRADGAFPIRYVYQSNGGKPAAVNTGVREARGCFTLILDSDDACVPHALQTLHDVWESIPEGERHQFSGVTVHAIGPDGRRVGSAFPERALDAHPYEMAFRHGVRGEKWGCHRTALLRETPYLSTPGERWVPEALVWNRLGRRYLVRHANVELRLYEPNPDGITAQIRGLMLRNPNGTAQFYNELQSLPIGLRWRVGAAIRYVRFALHARRSLGRVVAESVAPALTVAALPAGALARALDRLRAGRGR